MCILRGAAMRSNLLRILFLVILTALSAPLNAQDKSKAATGERRVMRFISFQNDSQWWFVASAPEGGPAVRFMMTEDVRKTARGPSPGSRLVWVTTRPGAAGLEMVTEVTPFDGPKELEAATTYVFDGTAEEKVGVATTTVARFSKFGQTRSVLLPTKPGLGGRAAADPAMLEKLKSF